MNKKKILAAVLAGFMTVSLAAPALADEIDVSNQTGAETLQDGTYDADVTFDFQMLRINPYYNNGKSTLVVNNGTKNLTFTLISTGWDRFYIGSVGDAAAASEEQRIQPKTVSVYKGYDSAKLSSLKAGKKKITVKWKKIKNYDDAYQFTIPIINDGGTDFAARGTSSGKWYAHSLTYKIDQNNNNGQTVLAANTTGFEVQYSLKKDFSSSKTKKIVGGTKKTATINKLKSKKKYYVHVRAIQTTENGDTYSDWSAAKTVKVK